MLARWNGLRIASLVWPSSTASPAHYSRHHQQGLAAGTPFCRAGGAERLTCSSINAATSWPSSKMPQATCSYAATTSFSQHKTENLLTDENRGYAEE